MKICATSFLLKNILLHEKKPDIGNGVEHSAQTICPECSTPWPSTQHFRSILQVIYQIGLHKLEVARNLLMADLPLAIVAQLLFSEVFTRPRHDHRQQLLAEEGIGYPNDLHIGDFGMANQEFLDLAREEVLAAANDHVFEATHNVDIALRVHGGQVTRMEPAVCINGLSSRVFHIVVACHNHEATIAQLAALSDWN